jgi:urease accessory protein
LELALNLRQSGSSKAVFPRVARQHVRLVLVNTAGGVTERRCFETGLRKPNAADSYDEAAEPRATRCQQCSTVLNCAATPVWIGCQETILFDNCV